MLLKNRVISKSNISRKLNISEELIEGGFEQLIRMGYIKEDVRGSNMMLAATVVPIPNHVIMPIKLL